MSEAKAARTVIVRNPQGMHLRPADLFVKLAGKYQCKIEVIKDHERTDGKSIMGILALGATEGAELRIEAEGLDAEAALDALAELFAKNFEE